MEEGDEKEAVEEDDEAGYPDAKSVTSTATVEKARSTMRRDWRIVIRSSGPESASSSPANTTVKAPRKPME